MCIGIVFAVLFATLILALVFFAISDDCCGSTATTFFVFSMTSLATAAVCIFCLILYAVAPARIEREIMLPVHTIDGVQYVQYISPNKEEPVITNVNAKFDQSFNDGDTLLLTIYEDGPYNGFYGGYNAEISLLETHVPIRKK